METKVVYLMSGPAHLPYLAVSLHALRRHWEGPVDVFAYPESQEIAGKIASDRRLDIRLREWEPSYRGKNGQFLQKIQLMEQLDAPRAIYLDADTMPVGPLDELVDLLRGSPMVLTQFNQWRACEGLPRKRVAGLVGREAIPQAFAERAISPPPLPSVNGGVFGCWPGSPLLSQWRRYTQAVKDIFIADETVLHVLVAEYENSSLLSVVEGGHMNCSPKFQPVGLADEDVRIWHFHGDCNARKNKSQKGFDLWWPVYKECLNDNIGGIAEWNYRAVADNKHLRRAWGTAV